MKITTIEQCNFHRGPLQLLRGIQSGESTPQNQDAVPRRHSERSFRRNLTLTLIISSSVGVLHLIRRQRKPVLSFHALALALFCLFPALHARADDPTPRTSDSARPAVRDSSRVRTTAAPMVVFGFLGGYVHHDDSVHSTVMIAQNLRKDYRATVHIETFENHRMSDAHGLLMYLLGAARTGTLTDEQKKAARIILYGHSWGASTVVALAQQLKSEGIPVLLTIQVDSVAKHGQNDAVIPDNVRYAANFYQDKGLVHGQQKIQAADASHTQILGNFRMDYADNPVSCAKYPWYTRVFMRSHIEIECDPQVWQKVEDLIREQLPTSVAAAAANQR